MSVADQSKASLSGVILALVTVQIENSRVGAVNGEIDQHGDNRLPSNEQVFPCDRSSRSNGSCPFEQFET